MTGLSRHATLLLRALAAMAGVLLCLGAGFVVGSPLVHAAKPGFYRVTFTETNGLPPGTPWSVLVNSTNTTSNRTTLSFLEPNGTYSYTLVAGTYTPNPPSGMFTVAGTPVKVSVSFTPVEALGEVAGQPTILTPIGGNASWTWTVVNYGSLCDLQLAANPFPSMPNTTTPALSLSPAIPVVPEGADGTPHLIASVAFDPRDVGKSWSTLAGLNAVYPGYNCGSGSCVGVGVAKTVTVDPFYPSNVTFSEHGLPSGVSWSVSLSGSSYGTSGQALAGQSIRLQVPNGTYNFSALATNYTAAASTGTLTFTGGSVAAPVFNFSLVQYPVNFTESSLPPGTSWTVTFWGHTRTTNGTVLSFSAPNGTHAFSVENVYGYTVAPEYGNVSTNGGSTTTGVGFTARHYVVTIEVMGLPFFGGVWPPWTVDFGGSIYGGQNGASYAYVNNGSYAWSVSSAPSGFSASPSSGTVKVRGSSVTLFVKFSPASPTVWFNESGLPHGTVWQVGLNDTDVDSVGSSIVFSVTGGTYSYQIFSPAGYIAQVRTGNLTLSGPTAALTVTFVRFTYAVTVHERGLPSGTSWSVTVQGSTLAHAITKSPNGTAIKFNLANGTYSFTITSSGYSPAPSSGNFTVNGGSLVLSTTFESRSPMIGLMAGSGFELAVWL